MKMKCLLVLFSLSILNFSCTHKPKGDDAATAHAAPSSEAGACVDSVCRIRVEGYPQEVAVLIPPYADYKHVTLFLHEFSSGKERDHDLDAIMKDLEIVKSFKDSRTDRILIIPYSSGQNQDYRKIFKNKQDIQAFLESVYKVFAMKVIVEDLHLIAHGRATLTLQKIVQDHSSVGQDLNISQVTLLDATSAEFNPKIFVKWLKSSDNKMTMVYLKNSPIEKKALKLWSRFSKQKPGKAGGFNLENADYLTLIPEAELRHQPDAHWLLARKWFGRIL